VRLPVLSALLPAALLSALLRVALALIALLLATLFGAGVLSLVRLLMRLPRVLSVLLTALPLTALIRISHVVSPWPLLAGRPK
jgi:hypothetical protein